MLLALVLASTAATAAPSYRLVKLAPPAGAPSSVARAISANGSIAGEGFVSSSATGNTPINFGNAGAPAAAFTGVPAGTTNGFVRGINDSGIAAGTGQNADANTSRAILTGTGGLTVLVAASGFANAGANGINNGGTVVGYSMQAGIFGAEGTARPFGGNGNQQATVWDSLGNATTLANPFGNFNSIATAVNASGQVVGVANRAVGALSNAVIWNGGTATALATGASERSTARAISSSGWVAGRTDQNVDGSYLGSVWAAGGSEYALAPVGGCAMSDLRGINASNNAVGFSQQGPCSTVGTYWQWNGSGYTGYAIDSLVINLDGWSLTAPQAINDRGQIVGFGVNELGVTQGFLLEAVPEPSSWAMLIAGFGLVGAAARRRRDAGIA
jgi:uncharacterized membrane protein